MGVAICLMAKNIRHDTASSKRANQLLQRIKVMTWVFIAGLIISGATAIPLRTELDWLVKVTNAEALSVSSNPPAWVAWLVKVQSALNVTGETFPFLFYGTDWLAFGHFAIAVAFVGALIDPVRNRWLFTFGMISCALVIPYAFVFGAVRGIPIWWRLVDCSFGVFGFVPLWFCNKWALELERAN